MSLRQALLYPIARRFFAGETLESAVQRAIDDNDRGVGVTFDYLGEDVDDGRKAEEAMREYLRLLDAISFERLNASLSIKLTHIGLDISRDLAENNALKLQERASGDNVFLWVDMEGSAHTDDTIGIYKKMLARAPAGIALQAYLKRTPADAGALVKEGAVVRLVKGAYREPPDIAYQDMGEIRESFLALAGHLFQNAKSFAVGTHDRRLIDRVLEMEGGTGPAKVEYQMLMGMRDDIKRRLVEAGRRVVEYVPYGSDWYGYGIRRLKEKRRNIVYFVQGLAGR